MGIVLQNFYGRGSAQDSYGVALALGVLLCLPGFFPAVVSLAAAKFSANGHIANFSENELDALQSLWGAWNKSTPSTNTTLAGWFTAGENQSFYPCNTDIERKWLGLTCLQHQQQDGSLINWIVGLTLDDASIVGTLPPEIGKLDNLVTLSLTGNPNLTGPLPPEIGGLPLNILDLHDNGFTGTIPNEFGQLEYVSQLDLSGNHFVGPYPDFFSLSMRTTFQSFKIARNSLKGDIPPSFPHNISQLLTWDISSNELTGVLPNMSFITNLHHLNVSSNLFIGLSPLPTFINSMLPRKLAELDFSNLNIGGAVPNWDTIVLPYLESLYLDSNNFTGVLDISAVSRGHFGTSLKVLSLKNNNITDVIYTNASMELQLKIFLQGNPYCEGSISEDDGRRCYCEQICFISPKSKNDTWKVSGIIGTCSAILLALVILIFSLVLHRNKKHMRSLYEEIEASEINAKRYKYFELLVATRNFSPAMKLGAGAFGAVYKGILPNKTEVAVKQLFLKTKEGRDDFINEVLLVSNLQHRNLVTLKGYSLHGREMLLVYEYVENRDLDKLLLSPQSGVNPLNWQARRKICLGVAQGLYYLHASSQFRILHRDIKASNILLDKNLNPKIADFGLARPMHDERSKIITDQRAGTLGYLAPEYVFFGRLSEKADVFSFGVLLLEILSGKRNRHTLVAEDDEYLPIYAWRLQCEGKLMELVDQRLELGGRNMEVQRVLHTAILCVQMSPEKRPTMFRVLAMLAGHADIVLPATSDLNTWTEFHQFSSSVADCSMSWSVLT
uniref:Leucine-rich repeat receptor-like protein kinase n=1 Tax=Pohlia nutans TaxID=140635 RepID=A0A1P8DYV8_9BRYO|nr:leucine-rich repeat receptor-like protein kinase [Pohlia nutans]